MQKHVRFSALDGLRGFAAAGVFFYHGADITGFNVPSGYLAVDFFFCLSGFVIAAAYEQKLLAGETVARFLIARLTRLYPVYLLGMALGLTLAVIPLLQGGKHVDPFGFAVSLTLGLLFVPSPPELVFTFSTRTFPFVIQAWSLFYELVANVLYAATVRFLTVVRILLLLLILLPFLVSATFSFGSLDLGPEWSTMASGFARAFFSFFAGVLVFRLRSRALVLPAWTAWACVIVLLATFAVRVDAPAWRAGYDLLVAIFVFPAVTFVASAAVEEPRSRAIFSFAGAASYPLYILHGAILSWIRTNFHADYAGPDSLPQTLWLLVFALIIIASACIDLTYERWAIRRLRARFAG